MNRKGPSILVQHVTAAVVAIGVSLAASLSVYGKIATPAAEAPSDKSVLADRLATLLNSVEVMIGSSGDDERARPMWLRILSSDPDIAAFEKDYPGTINEMIDGVLPIVNNSLTIRLPELQRRQAKLYLEYFNEAELDFLIKFYASPTGTKLLKLLSENMQTDNIEASIKTSDEMKVSVKAVQTDLQSTARAISGQFDASDKAVLEELAKSPAAPKLKRMAPATQRLALDWYEEYLPGEEAEIDALFDAILTRRMKVSK